MKITITDSKNKHLVSITDKFNVITEDKKLKKAIEKRFTKTKTVLKERVVNEGKKDEHYVLEEIVVKKGQREYFYELYSELFRALCNTNVRFSFKEVLRHSIASEGGPGSGNFGHKGRKGHRGGSLKGTGGIHSFGGTSTSDGPDKYDMDGDGELYNSEGFKTVIDYSGYKTWDDYFESSFNSGEKLYESGSEFECFDTPAQYRRSRSEEFSKVRELAKKDAQLDAITEGMLYERFKAIDEMDYDAVTIDMHDSINGGQCTVLAKHELQREYVQTLLNERYESNCFEVEYTPWASADIKNRFKDGRANVIYDEEEYLITVRDSMVRNYCQTVTGVAMGYDHLWNTGMIDDFNLLNDRGSKIKIEEVYHYDNNPSRWHYVIGCCWNTNGNISYFSSSTKNEVRGFSETVFHENGHKLHGAGGSWSSSSYMSAPQLFYQRNKLGQKGFYGTFSNTDFLDNQFAKFNSKNSGIAKSIWLPSLYGGTNSKEFFAECVSNYMSPQGVLNPKNLSKLSGVQKEKYTEISKWIADLIGKDKAIDNWDEDYYNGNVSSRF